MKKRPLTWVLLIMGSTGTKTGHFRDLSPFERMYAVHLHRKHGSDVLLGRNEAGDRVIEAMPKRGRK